MLDGDIEPDSLGDGHRLVETIDLETSERHGVLIVLVGRGEVGPDALDDELVAGGNPCEEVGET